MEGDMRRRWAVTAWLGIVLTSAGALAQESASAPQITVLSERDDRPAPTILRGRAATPQAEPAAEADEGWLVLAGERLWLIDPASGEMRACRERDTSTVGRREIRCTTGELGPYSRTFGATFQP
jgi:hypothetical protein